MSKHPASARAAAVAVAGAMALAAALVTGGGASAQQSATPPLYQQAGKPIESRVRDLLGRMSLAEKVGQMGQINVTSLQGEFDNPWDRGPWNQEKLREVLSEHQIGSILSGGGAWPPPPGNDARAWATAVNELQAYAIEHQAHGIPLIYGVDAVHGHNNLSDATIFPHQISIGATFDRALAERLGRRTARAVRATGITWNFSPVLDTQRDLRWGRSYEPFGEDPLLNGELGTRHILGQERWLRTRGVAATAKHFVGYSAPDTGQDRSNATIGEPELQDIHLPPFAKAIDAGVETVMVNSGAVNGEPVHASRRLLTDVLRGQLGFDGVVVTDWNDIEMLVTKWKVAANMEEAVALSINAGIDVSMIPIDAPGFTSAVLSAIEHGRLTEARIDESVARILRLKFRLGLFEHPMADAGAANGIVEDPADRRLARRAAEKSLVLLENDGSLPLSAKAKKILVTGPASDSPANQLGGWTIGWQGAFGLPPDVTVPETTTLREAIEAAAPDGTEVAWSQGVPVGDTTARNTPRDPVNDPAAPATAAAIDEAVSAAEDADAIVVAVGESPYAEGQGDELDGPRLAASQAELVDELEATGAPVIVVVVAGRPLEMDEQLDQASAALMAFWPGSEGGTAIARALFGKVNPTGRLSVSWPEDGSEYPLAYNEAGTRYDPRYPFGYGLSYGRLQYAGLSAPTSVGTGDRVRLAVDVTTRGDRGGEYPVLAMVQRVGGPATAPRRQLVAFERVRVQPHETTRVRLAFDVSQLAVHLPGESGAQVVPGTYRLLIGDERLTFTVG